MSNEAAIVTQKPTKLSKKKKAGNRGWTKSPLKSKEEARKEKNRAYKAKKKSQ